MKALLEKDRAEDRVRATISRENYAFLQSQIYHDSGVVLDDTKQYLVESRLLPIVRKENLTTLNDLCTRLRVAPESARIRREVAEAMTTNETLFFRDIAAFDALRDHVLPSLVEKRRPSRTLSIWSAAASSGQEAYSIAMLLLEMSLSGWNIRILGTDLNASVLERARAGRYSQLEINRGLPAKYLIKYFHRAGLEWQIKEEVQRLTQFRTFDLRCSMHGLGQFDLVLCRNVLIYFDVNTKKKILGGFLRVLNEGGLLLLGSAETTLSLEQRFSPRLIGRTSFYESGLAGPAKRIAPPRY